MKAHKFVAWFILLMMTAGLCQAATFTINKTDAGANFSSLTAALSSTSLTEGSTLQFTDASPVTYTEAEINWTDLNVPANISLTALNPNTVQLNIQQRIGDNRTINISNLNFGGNTGMVEFFFFAASPAMTISNCNFNLGGVGDYSSCIWVHGGQVNVTNSSFKNMVGGGSRVFHADWGSTISVTDSTIDNIQCTVYNGWANYANTLNMTRCTVTNASQLEAANWAIIASYGGTVNITDCTLQATAGRIITGMTGYLADALTVNVKNTKLIKTGDGTIVRSQAGKKLVAKFDNCFFDGGWVNLYADAAQADASSMTCNHCLFLKSTGAMTFGDGYDTIAIKNSIITAESLGINTGGGHMTIDEDYNLINMPGGYLAGAHDLDGRTVAIDPMWANPVAKDYRLQDTSPLLGKGIDLGLTVDFAGNARPSPVGSAPDIGPYESILVPVELSTFGVE